MDEVRLLPCEPTPELKSCPFCGVDAWIVRVRDWVWVAECDKDKGGCGIGAVRATKAEAIAAWNTRNG